MGMSNNTAEHPRSTTHKRVDRPEQKGHHRTCYLWYPDPNSTTSIPEGHVLIEAWECQDCGASWPYGNDTGQLASVACDKSAVEELDRRRIVEQANRAKSILDATAIACSLCGKTMQHHGEFFPCGGHMAPMEWSATPFGAPKRPNLTIINTCSRCDAPIYGVKDIGPDEIPPVKYTCDCRTKRINEVRTT